MGLYNFRPGFVPHVLDGSKRHTIRLPRRHQDRPGSLMHLFTGLRQPGAKLLFRAPCVRVEPIAITEDGRLILDGSDLSEWEKDQLAWSDGFRTDCPYRLGAFTLMFRFWRITHQLPFEGFIFHWDYERRVTE